MAYLFKKSEHIKEYHGFLIYGFYYLFCKIFDIFNLTRLWFLLAEKQKRLRKKFWCDYDLYGKRYVNKAKSQWQDCGVLVVLFLIILVSFLGWKKYQVGLQIFTIIFIVILPLQLLCSGLYESSGFQKAAISFISVSIFLITIFFPNLLVYILIVYFLLDIICYHSRVLWFDDLDPTKKPDELKVWSHRRILFQAIINFAESILLFAVLYHQFDEESRLCFRQTVQKSFEIAASLQHSIELRFVPYFWTNLQIIISLFFFIIVISIIASVGYSRDEISPSTKKPFKKGDDSKNAHN